MRIVVFSSSSDPALPGGRLALPPDRVLQDLLNERFVADPHLGGGLRKVVCLGEGRIGVCLDDDDFVLRGQPDIDAAHPADVQDAIDAPRELGELALHGRRQRPRGAIANLPLLAVRVVPLRLRRSEARSVVAGGLAEEDLARRKDREPLVAQHAEVELSSVDVFLDEGVALEALVQEACSIDHLLLVLRKRGERDAVACLLANGFDERRIRKATEAAQRTLSWRHEEARNPDAMEGEELLRKSLVLAEHQRVGASAGVRDSHQLEQRRYVRLVRPIGQERLAKIEDEIRLEELDLVEDGLHFVEDGQRLHVVPELAQAREHVGFHRLALFRPKGAKAEGLARTDGTVHVEEDEDLHYTDLLNRPVYR